MAYPHSREPQGAATLTVLLGMGGVLWIAALGIPTATAAESAVPWECSNYTGEAQTRCIHALLEVQREQIGQLREEIKTQAGTIGQLRDQVERQAAATNDVRQQLSHLPTVVQPGPPLYAVPPIGLGLYPGLTLQLGRPWGYRYGGYRGLRLRPFGGFYGGYSSFGHCRRHWRAC